VSTLTKRRQAPVAATAIVAGAATLAIGALPLNAGVRAACMMLVLLVAVREISEHWRSAAIAAVREDRRRVARDLHDGLAQELAFISSQSERLARSLTLVGALSRTNDEPLEHAIARAAQDVAVRAGACVELSLEPDARLERETEDALVRIVREAVTNAVRHGGAENVRVQLVHAGGVCLRVDDDGSGISDQPVAGFGLASMRERAEGLGGAFRVLPRPGGGTIVEVSLP
jgi:signal transduction histidine kinase